MRIGLGLGLHNRIQADSDSGVILQTPVYDATSFTLNWSGGTGPYYIKIGTDYIDSTANTTYQMDDNVAQAVAGAIVTIEDSLAVISNPQTLDFNVDPLPPELGTPSQSGRPYSEVAINVDYKNNNNYNMFRSEDNFGSQQQLVSGSTDATFLDSGLGAIKEYKYRANAVLGAEVTGDSNTATLFTRNAPLLGIGVSITDNFDGTYTFNFVFDAPGVEPYISTVQFYYEWYVGGLFHTSGNFSTADALPTFTIPGTSGTSVEVRARVIGGNTIIGDPSDEVISSSNLP